MRLLVITNIYPPQELGGYGRCMADFVWGFQRLGHYVQVLTSDLPYLSSSASSPRWLGPNLEPVSRTLFLKGSYEDGVTILQDTTSCSKVDSHNIQEISNWLSSDWDAVLLGNIDLLGYEIIPVLLASDLKILHHVGFVNPPYPPSLSPDSFNYVLVSASHCVRQNLIDHGMRLQSSPVVYPGVRCDLFSPLGSLSPALKLAYRLSKHGYSFGTPVNPLKIGFAGLLMGSKGLHTIVLALIKLHQMGYVIQASIAGAPFQDGYRNRLEDLLTSAGLDGSVSFVGQLDRAQLTRFWSLHQIGIFPSIHPEAFGIVAAEIMASGLVLLSTGVGGSSEFITSGHNGICFTPDNSSSLVEKILELISIPDKMVSLAFAGQKDIHEKFSVQSSVSHLESLILS